MKTNKKHQDEALAASKGREYFAYFMDPGTGKTRVELLDAYREYERGRIDALLVLAPNNVKASWVSWDHWQEPGEMDQVTDHLGDRLENIIKGVWVSSASGKDKKAWTAFEEAINKCSKGKLIILVVNYEALLSEQFFTFLKEFCETYRTMACADESTRIGNKSDRTKRAIKLADLCVQRRILTGTPIIKSPVKIYYQARFLSPNALPFRTKTSFRNRYCILGGFKGKEVLGYQNMDELGGLIAEWSFRARKKDCLDLPPQIFMPPRRVDLTQDQLRAYGTMRDEFFAHIKGEEVTASIVLAQMTRLQQIAGGYLKKDDKVLEIVPPERNPKLLETFEIVEGAPGQMIAWFRFREELAAMATLLRKNKISFLEFHGGISQKDRPGIKSSFKRGDAQVLLGTEDTGGIGINEFLVADTVAHVSYDFNTEKRVQSDDRTHRMGSEIHEKITYYDIVARGTVDSKILRVMRGDQILSAKVLKDNWRDWV